MVKRVISHLVINRDEVVIMDMEAGLEHLGRGTASMVDRFMVVIEPGERSIQTYHKVKALAADLGVKAVSVVANKVRGPEDGEFLKSRIPAEDLFGFISYNDEISEADRRGVSPYDTSEKAKAEIMKIKERIDASILKENCVL
jgi:CO dehydrogenase maturation factor